MGSTSAKFGLVFNVTQIKLTAFQNAARYMNSETNLLRRDDCPMSTQSLVMLGPRTPENYLEKVLHLLKIWRRKCAKSSTTVLSRTLAYCREMWQDDARQDCVGSGVVKIHFRSKWKLPTASHSVRKPNSSFDQGHPWGPSGESAPPTKNWTAKCENVLNRQ